MIIFRLGVNLSFFARILVASLLLGTDTISQCTLSIWLHSSFPSTPPRSNVLVTGRITHTLRIGNQHHAWCSTRVSTGSPSLPWLFGKTSLGPASSFLIPSSDHWQFDRPFFSRLNTVTGSRLSHFMTAGVCIHYSLLSYHSTNSSLHTSYPVSSLTI